MNNKDKLLTGLSSILVLCALFVVGLLVHRYFFSSKPKPKMQKRTIEDWKTLSFNGQRIGPKDAPVQIVEFFDYQCPYCKSVQPVVKAIHKKYPKKVAIIHENFPLKIHQNAFEAAIAAECARRQKSTSFMAYHDSLFAHQDNLGQDDFYQTIAVKVGISDIAAFEQCLDNKATESIVKRGIQLADSLNIHAIPTFLINGTLVSGALSKQQLNTLVQHGLAKVHR